MKKYIAFYTAAVFLVLCSCATTPKNRFTVDPFSLKYPAGVVDAQCDKLLSSEVQKKEVSVSYLPDEDAVCLESRIDFVTYYQYWDRLGREGFKTALERYKVDYEQRNLSAKNGRKERQMYGTVRGYLAWQAIGLASDLAQGPIELDVGYTFKGNPKNKTPYFTITQNEAEYIFMEGASRKVTSPRIKLYFTRAQADELAIIFDQEFLSGLRSRSGFGPSGVDVDEY